MKIETPRLILRKLKKEDVKDLIEGAGDFNVAKFVETIPHPYTKKDALWIINKSQSEWDKKQKSDYIFGIELKSEKKLIGIIHFGNIKFFHGTATTGSWINRKYWRQGYITEAKIHANEFIFKKLKLRKLNSTVFTKNLASNKTQQKMGYKKEGIKRKESKSLATGKIRDLVLYGLFKEDWKKIYPKLKKELNKKLK